MKAVSSHLTNHENQIRKNSREKRDLHSLNSNLGLNNKEQTLSNSVKIQVEKNPPIITHT
jgi:hypothetical protein